LKALSNFLSTRRRAEPDGDGFCEGSWPILRTPARQAGGNLFRASRIVLLHPGFNPESVDGAGDAAPNGMKETGYETHHHRSRSRGDFFNVAGARTECRHRFGRTIRRRRGLAG
jgi:hypothetical protein